MRTNLSVLAVFFMVLAACGGATKALQLQSDYDKVEITSEGTKLLLANDDIDADEAEIVLSGLKVVLKHLDRAKAVLVKAAQEGRAVTDEEWKKARDWRKLAKDALDEAEAKLFEYQQRKAKAAATEGGTS